MSTSYVRELLVALGVDGDTKGLEAFDGALEVTIGLMEVAAAAAAALAAAIGAAAGVAAVRSNAADPRGVSGGPEMLRGHGGRRALGAAPDPGRVEPYGKSAEGTAGSAGDHSPSPSSDGDERESCTSLPATR